jgi:signal transduction histidine kinase
MNSLAQVTRSAAVSLTARIRPLRAITAPANRDRLLWAVRVRWLAIAGFSVLSALAWSVGVLPSLGASAVAGAASAALNIANHWCVSRWRWVRAVTALAIPSDVFLITYLVVHTGGTQSPFLMLYVVQVIATAMLVDFAIAAASALASALSFLIAVSLVPATITAGLAPPTGGAAAQSIWGLFLLYCLALLTYVGGYIAERLRRSEGDVAERNAHLRSALSSLERAHEDLQRTVERLRSTEAQLVQSEKMRALGQFVAGIAHELNNPIGFVSGNLDHLRRTVEALEQMLGAYAEAATGTVAAMLAARRRALRIDPLLAELPSVLQDCEEGARRATEIVTALRTFARGDAHGRQVRVDLRERLDRTLALLRHRLASAVQITRDYGEVPPVMCIPGQLDQVWLNILANAIEAVGDRGTIWVSTRLAPAPAGAHLPARILISVRDDGGGMLPATRARIFEPFFSTKAEGQGIGLGLSVSYAIIERHGGHIEVESAPGCGSTFTVSLPVDGPAAAVEAAGAPGIRTNA